MPFARRSPPRPTALPTTGWPTYRLHQTLIGLRRRNPWLHTARTRTIHLTNRQMTLEARNGADHLLIALNLDDAGSVQPAPGTRHVVAGSGTIRQPGTPKRKSSLPRMAGPFLAAASG